MPVCAAQGVALSPFILDTRAMRRTFKGYVGVVKKGSKRIKRKTERGSPHHLLLGHIIQDGHHPGSRRLQELDVGGGDVGVALGGGVATLQPPECKLSRKLQTVQEAATSEPPLGVGSPPCSSQSARVLMRLLKSGGGNVGAGLGGRVAALQPDGKALFWSRDNCAVEKEDRGSALGGKGMRTGESC